MYQKFPDVQLSLFLTRKVLSWLEFTQRVLPPLLWLCLLSFLNPQRPLYEQVAVAVNTAEFSFQNVGTSLNDPKSNDSGYFC